MELHEPPLLGDAFGTALLAHLDGSPYDSHYVERSDGYIDVMRHAVYFATPDEWLEPELACLSRLEGRVLDIGAGAGRATLAARDRGLDATALDVSPGAIEACSRRGVEDAFLGTIADLIEERPGERYDTFLLLGNNVGLLRGPAQAPGFLDQLRALGRPGARVVGTVGHIYKTDNPDHLAYHDRNRSLGRMPGELRLRTRFRRLTSEWFDYLFASPDELAGVIAPAGWELADVVESGGYVYMVELRMA